MSIHTASIAELQTALRNKTESASSLLEAHISRIEAVNPLVNGFIADRFETARAEAKAADISLKGGAGTDQPLLGIPCTVKEFIGVTGQPQTGGVLWRADVLAEQDATVVSRIKAAGAIIMGTTNIPEGGLWLETYNAIHGRTKNPWNTKRTSGGSSGGEGVMVATGASAFGVGSDVGGSIRIPAAFCGTVGHKPSGGLVPNTGHYPKGVLSVDGGRFLCIGPLTRTVDDAWTILKIIAGNDVEDESMLPYRLGDPDSVDLSKLNVFPLDWNLRTKVTPELGSAVHDAAAALQDQGATVVHRKFAKIKKGFEIWSAMLSAATTTPYPEILGEKGRLKPTVELARLLTGRGRHTLAAIMMCTADGLASKLSWMNKGFIQQGQDLQKEIEDALGDNGVLLHPPYNRPAPAHWDAFRTPFAPAYTAIFNVLEFPVTQVPVGFSKGGLPLGVQVVGARGMDHLTIAAARCIEHKLGGWTQANPV